MTTVWDVFSSFGAVKHVQSHIQFFHSTMQVYAVLGHKRLEMLKQREERARTNAYRCSYSATHQGRRAAKCSQEGCLQQYTSSQGHCTYSSMYNRLEGTSNVFRHSVNRRQSWDGRVYHNPALLSPASNKQLRHNMTERVNKCSAANCCGCWCDKSPSVAENCMQHSTEELELVSLLQVLLFTTLSCICVSLCTCMQPCLLSITNLPTYLCRTSAVSQLHATSRKWRLQAATCCRLTACEVSPDEVCIDCCRIFQTAGHLMAGCRWLKASVAGYSLYRPATTLHAKSPAGSAAFAACSPSQLTSIMHRWQLVCGTSQQLSNHL